MVSLSHFATARRVVGLVGVLAIGACSADSTGPTTTGSKSQLPGDASHPASSDSTGVPASGEWHLATIRGLVAGLDRNVLGAPADTSATGITAVGGAKVQIHKVAIHGTVNPSSPGGGLTFEDLGIVATVTTDAHGNFEYVLSDPIVVKSGQPSPMTTYQLTITPPAGSPYASQSNVQVFFLEQFPAGVSRWNYFLNRGAN
ncbi:MAG: hypothetical protein ABJE47_07020 [bacterium]